MKLSGKSRYVSGKRILERLQRLRSKPPRHSLHRIPVKKPPDISDSTPEEIGRSVCERRPDTSWLGGPRGPSYPTSNLNKSQRRRIRNTLVDRDGIVCGWCKRAMLESDRSIHHRNHNPTDHHRDNLQLMHGICNRKEWASHKRSLSGPVREPATGRSSTSISAPLQSSDTDPLSVNRIKEPLFREFIFTLLKSDWEEGRRYRRPEGGTFTTRPKREYVLGAVSYVGESEATGYRHILKMISSTKLRDPHRPIAVMKDMSTKEEYLGFHDDRDYLLSVPELLRKYPGEGMHYSTDKEIREFLPSSRGLTKEEP